MFTPSASPQRAPDPTQDSPAPTRGSSGGDGVGGWGAGEGGWRGAAEREIDGVERPDGVRQGGLRDELGGGDYDDEGNLVRNS